MKGMLRLLPMVRSLVKRKQMSLLKMHMSLLKIQLSLWSLQLSLWSRLLLVLCLDWR